MNLWYVGYGSNLLPQGVANYLQAAAADRAAALGAVDEVSEAGTWVEFAHPLYFAGRSKTWGGGVAFVDLIKRAGHTTYGRASRLSLDEFNTVISRENGEAIQLEPADLRYLKPGQARLLQFEVDPEGCRGKYNAVLRLADIKDEPAYTLTTSRLLTPTTPASAYLQRIEVGLRQRLDEPSTKAYLQTALQHAPER